jgi:hypothetical protein
LVQVGLALAVHQVVILITEIAAATHHLLGTQLLAVAAEVRHSVAVQMVLLVAQAAAVLTPLMAVLLTVLV